MYWAFGPGLWHLAWLFWTVIWALLIWGLIRWFGSSNRRMPFSHPDQPPVAPSASDHMQSGGDGAPHDQELAQAKGELERAID